MAQGALAELRSAYELFHNAAPFGGRAVKMLVCLTFITLNTNNISTPTAHREEASGEGHRKLQCGAYAQRAIRDAKARRIRGVLWNDFHHVCRSFHTFAVALPLLRVINPKFSRDPSYCFQIDAPIFSTSRATTFIAACQHRNRNPAMQPGASSTH